MEATAWYLEEGSVETGFRFSRAVDRTLELLAANPHTWQELRPGIRRALVREFPYALLYSVEDERVEVFAVMHQRRHPDHWER